MQLREIDANIKQIISSLLCVCDSVVKNANTEETLKFKLNLLYTYTDTTLESI